MKKIACIIMTVVFMISTTSCINLRGLVTKVLANDEYLADNRAEQVMKAIIAKDKGTLRSAFSQKALSEAENIDVGIESLLSFVKGNVVSWTRDGSPVVSEEVEYGETMKQLSIWYLLETDKQKYLIFLLDYPVDEIEPTNKGLHTLLIIRAEDDDKMEGKISEDMDSGILIPFK